MAVAISAVEQSGGYPSRVLVSVTGVTPGDTVTITRSWSYYTDTVRLTPIVALSAAVLVYDAEQPFGVPLYYRAVVTGAGPADVTASPLTCTLDGGKVVLSDAITGRSAEVVITAMPSKKRSRDFTRFNVNGTPVTVSGPLGYAEADIELFTDSDSGREAVNGIVENATSGIVQVRTSSESLYPGITGYYSVTEIDEQRFSQDGTDARRQFVLTTQQSDPWSSIYGPTGETLQDINDAYPTPATLATLAGDYATLLAIAQAEF